MKKSTLLTIAALVLALAMGISGTMAYLTDTDSDVNVMVLGSIKIDQHEQDRNGNDFDQYQTLLPIVGGTSEKDNNGYPANGNYIDKIVTVENTGKNDAYVRTFIAVPVYAYEGQDVENASANVIHWNGYSKGDETSYPAAGKVPGKAGTVANNWVWGKDTSVESYWPGNGGTWNSFSAVIDGMNYEVFVVTNTEAVKPGEITAPNMIGVYLDSMVDYDHDAGKYTYNGKEIANFDGTVKVLVATQAVQFDSGWKDAFDALNTAFGAPAADKHPWTGDKAADTDLVVVKEGNALLNAIENGEKKIVAEPEHDDDLIIQTEEAIDFDGNGAKIELNGAAIGLDGVHKYGYLGFVPPKGEDATVSDLTVTGTGFVEVGHWGIGGGDYTVSNLTIKNLASTLANGDKGNIVALAFCHYGTATLNNCVMTGATAADPSATAYDIGFVNDTTTTINGGKYGRIYCWSHSHATINDAEVDYIDVAPIKGSLTIGTGTHVGTINFNYESANVKPEKLIIENGATVDKIIYKGVEYTQTEWASR